MINCNKNVIFTVTHGRTGTTLLTDIFSIFKDTKPEHEPAPNYASIHPHVKDDPRKSIDFLKEKFNHINQIKERNYVETSNVFGKAFLIPMLRMGMYPNLIFLNREFRKVATSLFQRGSTPGRTQMGIHYSADPTKPGSLDIFSSDTLSDYQMCFWGVLDSYKRQLDAEEIYKKSGNNNFFWITAKELNDYEKVKEMGTNFGLKTIQNSRAKHLQSSRQHHNPNPTKRPINDIIFIEEEVEVIDRLAYYNPLFVDKLLESNLLDPETLSLVSTPKK